MIKEILPVEFAKFAEEQGFFTVDMPYFFTCHALGVATHPYFPLCFFKIVFDIFCVTCKHINWKLLNSDSQYLYQIWITSCEYKIGHMFDFFWFTEKNVFWPGRLMFKLEHVTWMSAMAKKFNSAVQYTDILLSVWG